METSNRPQYVIPQLGKTYNHEDYPVGSQVVLRLVSAMMASNSGLRQMKSEGVILSYISVDTKDDAYSQIEVQWVQTIQKENLYMPNYSSFSLKPDSTNIQLSSIPPVKTILMLQNVLLLEDKEEYLQKDKEHRAIKFAMMEIGGAFHTSFNTWEEWAELEMDTTRKLALIKAGIPIHNITTYDDLTVEELSTLKHYLRVLEVEK